ncbi:RHS repeat-associated core domain-containing protein [Pseudomonas sp. LB3P31]
MPTHSRNTILLATDQQRSVLNALNTQGPHPIAYSPYGHRPAENGLLSLLGFNGEPPDPLTGCYHLGNGYRQFNPVLMRFNSPDSWSPFGEGGLNTYVYCGGEPILRFDRNGHKWGVIAAPLRTMGFRKSSKLKLYNAFENNPSSFRVTPTRFFNRAAPNMDVKLNSANQSNFQIQGSLSSLEYIQETNKLYLNRSITTDKFTFTTKIRINSKMQSFGPESLHTLTPQQGLNRADSQWINAIKNKMNDSKYLLQSAEVEKILHPIVGSNIARNRMLNEQKQRIRDAENARYKNSKRYKRDREEYWANKSGF